MLSTVWTVSDRPCILDESPEKGSIWNILTERHCSSKIHSFGAVITVLLLGSSWKNLPGLSTGRHARAGASGSVAQTPGCARALVPGALGLFDLSTCQARNLQVGSRHGKALGSCFATSCASDTFQSSNCKTCRATTRYQGQ